MTTTHDAFVATALDAWKITLGRADAFFSALDDAGLQAEIAPGRNRLIYLWGHLIAVHDAMLPLLGIGARLHPELDAAFLSGADRAVAELPSAAELKRLWNEVNGALMAGFARFGTADWVDRHTAVSPEDFAKNPLRNRLAVLLSRTGHIAYHVGQARLVGHAD